jgi:hypothetical protein
LVSKEPVNLKKPVRVRVRVKVKVRVRVRVGLKEPANLKKNVGHNRLTDRETSNSCPQIP